MRFGILTFQGSNNFGAILQAYALEKKIEELGHECIIINYTSPKKEGWYKPLDFYISKGLKHNIKQVLKIPNFKFVKEKNSKTDRFKKEKMNIGSIHFLGKSDEFEEYLNIFDIIIVGSDQVWNYRNTSFDKVYFLDFSNLKPKKVSYAASFGMSVIPSNVKGEYRRLISGFESVSVRENSGKEIVGSLTGMNAEVTLDPTLLHNKQDWENLLPIIKKRNHQEKYLLVYTIGRDNNINRLANEISKKYNLTIIKIMNDFRDKYSISYEGINPSVEEFLRLVNNAEFILTNSFHGVAFSINFNKNFFVYLNPNNLANTRIENLLGIADLTDRILGSENTFINMDGINYDEVNRLIEQKREESCIYINKLISLKRLKKHEKKILKQNRMKSPKVVYQKI